MPALPPRARPMPGVTTSVPATFAVTCSLTGAFTGCAAPFAFRLVPQQRYAGRFTPPLPPPSRGFAMLFDCPYGWFGLLMPLTLYVCAAVVRCYRANPCNAPLMVRTPDLVLSVCNDTLPFRINFPTTPLPRVVFGLPLPTHTCHAAVRILPTIPCRRHYTTTTDATTCSATAHGSYHLYYARSRLLRAFTRMDLLPHHCLCLPALLPSYPSCVFCLILPCDWFIYHLCCAIYIVLCLPCPGTGSGTSLATTHAHTWHFPSSAFSMRVCTLVLPVVMPQGYLLPPLPAVPITYPLPACIPLYYLYTLVRLFGCCLYWFSFTTYPCLPYLSPYLQLHHYLALPPTIPHTTTTSQLPLCLYHPLPHVCYCGYYSFPSCFPPSCSALPSCTHPSPHTYSLPPPITWPAFCLCQTSFLPCLVPGLCHHVWPAPLLFCLRSAYLPVDLFPTTYWFVTCVCIVPARSFSCLTPLYLLCSCPPASACLMGADFCVLPHCAVLLHYYLRMCVPSYLPALPLPSFMPSPLCLPGSSALGLPHMPALCLAQVTPTLLLPCLLTWPYCLCLTCSLPWMTWQPW